VCVECGARGDREAESSAVLHMARVEIAEFEFSHASLANFPDLSPASGSFAFMIYGERWERFPLDE